MVRLLLLLSLPLYIIDQITKNWVVANFELNGPGREVIADFFTLHHIANTGIAFGNFNGGQYSNYIFGAIALAAMGLITVLYRKGMLPGRLSQIAIALLVAGVCGNFTDRLLHGYVVDSSVSICTSPSRIRGLRLMWPTPASWWLHVSWRSLRFWRLLLKRRWPSNPSRSTSAKRFGVRCSRAPLSLAGRRLRFPMSCPTQEDFTSGSLVWLM